MLISSLIGRRCCGNTAMHRRYSAMMDRCNRATLSALTSSWRRYTTGGGSRIGNTGTSGTPFPDLSKVLSRTHASPPAPSSNGNFFDGNFAGGSPFIDAGMLKDMHSKLRESLTPEVRESMAAMMQSALGTGTKGRGLSMPDCGGGAMGMMAFGIGDNEKGKKVARAAKLSYDLKTGKVCKDFIETQIEPDDVSLPRETVHDYAVEDATEVQFVEDGGDAADASGVTPEPIAAAEVTIEGADVQTR